MPGDLQHLGGCHARLGRYAEALPHLQRAVTIAGQSEARGRVDLDSLATSLERIADCYTRLGKPAEARSARERHADPAPRPAVVS
jgi:tetratricopeptide (TPR) repeat protein